MNFDMSLSSQVIFEHIFSTLTTTQDIHGPFEEWANYPKIPTFNHIYNFFYNNFFAQQSGCGFMTQYGQGQSK